MKPKKSIYWTMILIVAILVLSALGASAKEGESSAIPKAEALSKLSKLHIPFIPNQGQMDERVKYYARTFGGTVFVTETGEMFYSLPKKDGEEKILRGWVLKEELLGGSIKGVRAEEEAPTRVSYFIGDDASRWRSGIPTYGSVNFGEVYEGIGVKVKAYGKSVEKLFCVKPGAKPGVIRLRLSGAESLGVNQEGELEVRTGLGEVKFSRPVAYQEVEGKRRYVEVSYAVEGSGYGFKLGSYDREKELVIDPVLQSTYLGGGDYDEVHSIAVDSAGNIYVAGLTYSVNFPVTAGAYQTKKGVSWNDAIVAKFDPTLTTLFQSTYLGGSDYDYAYSIAIDSAGNVYVAGTTWSTDFPGTAGGPQTINRGNGDAFVAKLNPTLSDLLQSTYLGDTGIDHAYSIAIGSGGNVYVAGYTTSVLFPGTGGGAQPSIGGGTDGFVAKLNPALTDLVQSTYLGGSGEDYAFSVAIGSGGNVYVTGQTDSTNFPGAEGGAWPYLSGGYDGFVAKLDPTLTDPVQSTYLGDTGTDVAYSVAIGPGGIVYVAGYTNSTNFPATEGGAQPFYGGGAWDVFVARLDPALIAVLQSTYLGGSGDDYLVSDSSIVIDSAGNVYVTGQAYSTDFPGTAGGPQPINRGNGDAFVAKLDPALTDLVQSTYLGGTGTDIAFSVAIGSGGNVYVAGWTTSTDFPGTAGGYQTSSHGGNGDAFVARLYSKLTEPPGAATLISPSGTVTTTIPEYRWTAVLLAAEYQLRVNDSTGTKILQWISSSEANCVSGTGECSYTPGTSLAAGAGKWWIQTKNSAGTGPLSSPMSFTVEGVSAPSIPEGPRNAETNTDYFYFVYGSASNVGHTLQYFFDWGDGTNSGWGSPPYALHSWASAGTYLVKAQARCALHNALVSSWSGTLSVVIESVSPPSAPTGPLSGTPGVSYVYSTGGSTSVSGHSIQYLFDWGDGTNSGWLAVGKTSASKSWALPGSYSVKAKARCSTHNFAISNWSGPLQVSMGKLTVLYPNGGEIFAPGSTYTIRWTSPFPQEKVKFTVLYSTDNGATWIPIENEIPGTSYDWKVPEVPGGNKNSCYVRVIGYNISNFKVGDDRSDKPFSIMRVRLLSPNGGDFLSSGLPNTISWQINGTNPTSQKLYYTMDGGATWSLTTTLDGVTRSFNWTAPTLTANRTNCLVKVVAYNGSTVVGSDTSDKPFTIAVGVRLTSPNGGEVLSPGSTVRITWTIYPTKSPYTNMSIYLSTDGGTSYVSIGSWNFADPGWRPQDWVWFGWQVPEPPSGNSAKCLIKVVLYSGSTVLGTDVSDKPFTIVRVKLLSPNGGEVLGSGFQNSISWQINGTNPTSQKLYYTMDGGATWSLITTLDGVTRSFNWTAPRLSANSTNCLVKVVAYNGNTIVGSDTSDKPFTIAVVRLSTPNGGEVLSSGDRRDIYWGIYGTKYPVKAIRVYYTMDGGATWSLIITLDPGFIGCAWYPLVQSTKTKCKVKVEITDTMGTKAADISDGYFTIQP